MTPAMRDVIVVGGGFAGVTAAREAALRGRTVLLLEARDRLGGRTWRKDWSDPTPIEYGGAWVHWHQPHTWSEITRAGLEVSAGDDAEVAAWYVDGERHRASAADRDAIAQRGWDQFVDGVREALPRPHDPLHAIDRLAPFDRMTIAERLEQLELTNEERSVLAAELESLAHAPLDDAGAVSVLRWHALSGYSLQLTQETGGRVTIVGGTSALLDAIASRAEFERRIGSVVAEVAQGEDRVEVQTRDGAVFGGRAAVVAVPINVLDAIRFSPELSEAKRRAIALGQASRGIKIFIHARGEPLRQNSIRPGHPFEYLATDAVREDGTQLLIGFGPDARRCDASDLAAVQRSSKRSCRATRRSTQPPTTGWPTRSRAGRGRSTAPGWYEHHHADMQRPEGRVLLAGADIANGWAGFIDGAIESGLRAGAAAAALSE